MLRFILLFLFIGACVIVSVNKQLSGSSSQPVEIQKKNLSKILLNRDRVQEYAHLIKDVKDREEAEVSTRKDLCLSILNQSDFTLIKLVARLTNKRTQATEVFNLLPVSGVYSGRTNPRVYYAGPYGINLWSGYFGDFLRDDDEVSVVILSAKGFK
jgi:hypothetical protein